MGTPLPPKCEWCGTRVYGERHACVPRILSSDTPTQTFDKLKELETPVRSSLDTQIGGDHYLHFVIQPVEFIIKNKLPFAEGNIIKYVCRHPDKGGEEDVRKVIHYAEHILQFKYGVKL